jgi:hypothetical protein
VRGCHSSQKVADVKERHFLSHEPQKALDTKTDVLAVSRNGTLT